MTAKRFTSDVDVFSLRRIICDNKADREYFNEIEEYDNDIEKIILVLNELHEEKEFWKSNCCNQDNFNRILLNELNIAQEQGYKLSDPFKKLMEEKEDL